MATTLLEVSEGLQEQSATERIAYTLDVTNYPGSSAPSSVVVKAIDTSDNSDVTSTVFPTNSPTVSGNVITLSLLRALTKGTTYRIQVKFTRDGNDLEPYFNVYCPY